LPASSKVFAVLVVRHYLPNGTRTQLCGYKRIKPTQIGCHGNIPWGIEKLTSGRSSTTRPANSVKIGPVDVEIIDLTEIVKNKKID